MLRFKISSGPPEAGAGSRAMGGFTGARDVKQPAANGGCIQKLTDIRRDWVLPSDADT